MKYLLIYVVISFAFAFTSCNNEQKKKLTSSQLPVFDLQKEYPLKRVVLQNIADVEYIPLETKKEALLTGTVLVKVDNETILIPDMRTGEIHLFDRKGKHLKAFCHKGESGEEYRFISSMTADFSKKEIYIFDYRPLATCYIKVYSFEGEFLRSLKMPDTMLFDLLDYDKDYLFGEEHLYVDVKDNDKVNHTPYYLISKQTGELKELPLDVENRVRNILKYSKDVDKENSLSISLNYRVLPISKSGNQIIISDFGIDTVFTYSNNQLTPIALKTNRTTEYQSTIMSEVDVLTDSILILRTQDKRVVDPKIYGSPDPQQLLYNRQSGELNKVQFDDANGIPAEDANVLLGSGYYELPSNYTLMYYKPELLLEKYESGKLKGELKQIASKLKEDDNPVLVLVKFKK